MEAVLMRERKRCKMAFTKSDEVDDGYGVLKESWS